MKTFEEYVDGEEVVYKERFWDPGSTYKAYKSKFTHNAFRLKNDSGEIVADISEISPVNGVSKYAKFDNYLQRGSGPILTCTDEKCNCHIDSDADASGIYHVQD